MIVQVTLSCGCKIGMSQHRLRKANNVAMCDRHGQQKIERSEDGKPQ